MHSKGSSIKASYVSGKCEKKKKEKENNTPDLLLRDALSLFLALYNPFLCAGASNAGRR